MRVLVIGREPNLFDENSEAFKRIRKYAGLFEELHIISGEKQRHVPKQYGNLFLWPACSGLSPFRLWKAWRLGKEIGRKYGTQIIDAQDPGEWGLVAWLVARSAKLPLRLQIHTDIFSPWYRRAGWKELLRYRLARFLIPRADCIRVVSERIKRSILSVTSYRLPANITVLPIFTDTEKFLKTKLDFKTEARFRNYDFKMISVGRFVDKEKNFSMLIRMMQDFVKVCPKALLVLVGDGPDRELYKLQATSYKLENNVIIESWRDDLPSFYKSFDLYLMSSNYEGWGRTAIEAMAAGVPMVMTDVGLAGEAARDGKNGRVIPVGDRNAMLEAVVEMYRDPEQRLRYGRAGLETIRNLETRTEEEYFKKYASSYCHSKNR
ncbi:MAG: glycosyltransferase family 4 protein [Candidatus Sungbacteria bacterium]|nr:glycosyltransferase family 4 protein [Candidatus Sungbacteria bacterium]